MLSSRYRCVTRSAALLGAVTLAACSSANPSSGGGGEPTQDASLPPQDAPHGSGDSGTHGGSNVSRSFRFGIVGDTRPANEDDTAHYPTAIITKIWADIASSDADFAVSTGDYQFSNPSKSQAAAQLDLYMTARAQFTGKLYAAMGNHECTGYTASNCGAGNTDGVTKNYTAFMTKMVTPLGESRPYYATRFDAADGSYTAKLVVIAANAWDSAQATWLETALADPTTYTFVVRHEDRTANTAPGVTPSETIINAHPITLRIVGHTHTYTHYATDKEVVCGNGGAPLTSGTNYGYGIVERLADGAVQFTEYDYQTNAVLDQFRVNADGLHAP